MVEFEAIRNRFSRIAQKTFGIARVGFVFVGLAVVSAGFFPFQLVQGGFDRLPRGIGGFVSRRRSSRKGFRAPVASRDIVLRRPGGFNLLGDFVSG